jgi:alginate O-acetyltransferase complex protein AlgI
MDFHSLRFFLFFLPLVVMINWVLCRHGRPIARKLLFLLASLAFYALSSWETLPILLGSLFLNWLIARRIQDAANSPSRRLWLMTGIALNVALLGTFKYAYFFVGISSNFIDWHPVFPSFILPLGISFFTIQQIMYLVDCYEELVIPAPLLDHAVFISFFPYISAGPIARARSFLPQLDLLNPSMNQIATGLMIFIIGLFKKVVLATTFGRVADLGFSSSEQLGLAEGWITAASYTFQLYFDFSGYCDMAIGIGLMLGLILPENFNSPFKAVSIIDFWKRWHITLSGFITTYLFTPIARAMLPLTFFKAMLATIISMTIAGIWHGAAWTFLIFGIMHGVALVINNLWRKTKFALPKPLSWAVTFIFLLISFVVFRADSWSQMSAVLSSMLGLQGLDFHHIATVENFPGKIILMFGVVIAFAAPNSNQFALYFKPSWIWCVFCCTTILICLFFLEAGGTMGIIYRGF